MGSPSTLRTPCLVATQVKEGDRATKAGRGPEKSQSRQAALCRDAVTEHREQAGDSCQQPGLKAACMCHLLPAVLTLADHSSLLLLSISVISPSDRGQCIGSKGFQHASDPRRERGETKWC